MPDAISSTIVIDRNTPITVKLPSGQIVVTFGQNSECDPDVGVSGTFLVSDPRAVPPGPLESLRARDVEAHHHRRAVEQPETA